MSESACGGKPVWRKYLWMGCKFALAAVIIYYLISSHSEDFRRGLNNFNYYFLIPASIAYFSHMLICGWRWYELAKMIGTPISLGEAVAVTMQGYFWSLVIPGGAIGGDVARVSIVASRMPKGGKAEGVLSILMDRIVGMVALFALTIVLVLVSLPQLMNMEINGSPLSYSFKLLCVLGLLGLSLGGIAAMLVLFFHRQFSRIGVIARLMKWGDQRSHGMVTRSTAAFDLYAKNWKMLSFLTLISVFFVHLMTVVAVIFLIYGLGFRGFSVLAVITAVTVGNIVGLLPFSISGIGPRDAVILILLRAGRVSDEASAVVPIIYSCLIVAFNLVGALFFIFDTGAKRVAEAKRCP
ncbi:MAG: YbhN family protein [Victivallaceae bacterium]|nr:lysylphosphatidylglycerol synthase transmembrane domain-containing protein [Victivallaceae bacterium]